MGMVTEQAPRVEPPFVARDDVVQEIQEELAVGVVQEDRAAAVSGDRDEVAPARRPVSSMVGHGHP